MNKRKKSRKKKKSKFPRCLTFEYSGGALRNAIITDAGFELIDYELALEYFCFEEMHDWWYYFVDYEKYGSIDIFPENFHDLNPEEKHHVIQEILAEFPGAPQQVDVVTARAVYGLEYRWVQLLTVIDKPHAQFYIDTYEEQAINLGIKMREAIGDDSLLIVNDNKHAVGNSNGCNFFIMRHLLKEFEQEKYEILWAPREKVKKADKLSIAEATRVFPPDAFEDWLEDDLDWLED